jgi:hypothetical protein
MLKRFFLCHRQREKNKLERLSLKLFFRLGDYLVVRPEPTQVETNRVPNSTGHAIIENIRLPSELVGEKHSSLFFPRCQSRRREV